MRIWKKSSLKQINEIQAFRKQNHKYSTRYSHKNEEFQIIPVLLQELQYGLMNSFNLHDVIYITKGTKHILRQCYKQV